MLQINDEPTKFDSKDKDDNHNKEIRGGDRAGTTDRVGGDNKNLSTIANSKN